MGSGAPGTSTTVEGRPAVGHLSSDGMFDFLSLRVCTGAEKVSRRVVRGLLVGITDI